LLPLGDAKYLSDRNVTHLVVPEANMTCILLRDFSLPPGYNLTRSDLLLRLSPGYPDVAPDMWWFDPPIRRADGQPIPATEVMELHLGRNWQRWSRHLSSGQWRSGVDGVESFLALVRRELERSLATG
jgi:Prokaryotic E2 family E